MDACCAHKYPQHNTVITWSLRQLDLESGCCSIIKSFFFFFKSRVGEFPVCPVVRTLYLGADSVPGGGTKISQAAWCGGGKKVGLPPGFMEPESYIIQYNLGPFKKRKHNYKQKISYRTL